MSSDIELPKSTLDISGKISQKQFHQYIYNCFEDACLQSNRKPSRELFQETLDTDPRFAKFIETLNKKFRLDGFDGDSIIGKCLQDIGA